MSKRSAIWGAWAVHAFTASGAALGLMALERAFERDFVACFAWLAAALAVDGIDGSFARALRVKERLPHIDGDILDYVVDYLTYVIVPAVAFLRSDLAPAWLDTPLALAIAASSAIYFGDARMKTADHWFRGFPALWNVLVFYLIVFAPPAWACAALIVAAIAAMFAPIVFVHPMRVTRLRAVTLAALGLWAASAALALASGMTQSGIARAGLLASAAYFLALPWLTRRGLKPDP